MTATLIDRKSVLDMLEATADENEAVRRSDETDLDYRRRTALANAARTLIRKVEAMPASDAGRRQGFEEGLQFAARQARHHSHHAHWQGLLDYGWDEKTEMFGRGLAVRIGDSIVSRIELDWQLHNQMLALESLQPESSKDLNRSMDND